MTNLETPTNDLLEKYINQFNNDERYYRADQAIIKLFKAFPYNKKLEDIFLKLVSSMTYTALTFLGLLKWQNTSKNST